MISAFLFFIGLAIGVIGGFWAGWLKRDSKSEATYSEMDGVRW